MPPISPDLVGSIVEAGKDILKEAANLTSGRDPNYIRDAQPENVIDAIALAGARQGCRRYANNPDQYSGRRLARVERACRPYLDDIGKPPGPEIELPFRGGQCNIGYFVNGTLVNYASDGSVDSSGPWQLGVQGPIGGLSFANSGGAPVIGPLAPGAQGFYAFLTAGGVRQLAFGNGNGGVSGSITSVTPQGPVPDNCGNPPPEYKPPARPTVPDPPGPQPFNPTPDIDIDIDVTINPDLTINFDIGTGPITIDPFGDDDGDDDGGDGGDGGPSDGPPGDPGDPGDPEDIDEGEDAAGCAPAGKVLTGVRVQILEFPPSRRKYTDDVFRGAYYAYLGMPGLLDHDPAGAMATADQFIFSERDNLTCYRIRANTGYKLRVTPYYRTLD